MQAAARRSSTAAVNAVTKPPPDAPVTPSRVASTSSARRQHVEGAHRLGHHHAERGEPGQQRRELAVLVPAGAALALADRVVAEHHHPGPGQQRVEALQVGLEAGVLHPVAGRVHDAGVRPGRGRPVDVRRHDQPGTAS